jgi:hypothetical protein
VLRRSVIEKYSNKNIDDKKLIFIKFNLIYWSECWLFDALQLTNIEIYLYSTIYEMNNFDVELDSYLSRSHVVKWISRNEILRESFNRILVLRFLAHFVIRSLRIWAWSLNRWVRLIEDLAETIEQALLDLREAMRWLDVAYSYSGRGRNNEIERFETKQHDEHNKILKKHEKNVVHRFIESFLIHDMSFTFNLVFNDIVILKFAQNASFSSESWFRKWWKKNELHMIKIKSLTMKRYEVA